MPARGRMDACEKHVNRLIKNSYCHPIALSLSSAVKCTRWCADKLFLSAHNAPTLTVNIAGGTMKISKWTVGLAAAGVVSLGSVVQADEAAHQVLTAVSSTTLSGYVSASAIWNPGTGRNTFGTTAGAVGGLGSYTGGAKQDGFNLDVVN